MRVSIVSLQVSCLFFSFFFPTYCSPSSFSLPYDWRQHVYQCLPKSWRKCCWQRPMQREPQISGTLNVHTQERCWYHGSHQPFLPITPPSTFLFLFPTLFSGQQLSVNRMWELQWNVFKPCTPPSSPLAATCILPGTSASHKYKESSNCAGKGTAWSSSAYSSHPHSLTFKKYRKSILLLTGGQFS